MTDPSVIMPVIASVMATVLAALIGMLRSDVKSVKDLMLLLDNRLATHVENKDLHYAALAKTDEQLQSLLRTVEKAHERIDRVEARE